MQSGTDPRHGHQHDESGAPPEDRPGRDLYGKVAREVLAHLDQRLDQLERAAAAHELQRETRRGTSRVWRRLAALLLVGAVGGAIFVGQHAGDDGTGMMLARWLPQPLLRMVSTEGTEQAGDTAGPGSLKTSVSPSQEAPQVMATPDGDGRPLVALRELSPILQKMAGDIQNLEQGIAQLKAGQDQMGRENLKAAEQLRASEDQLIRMILRLSEQAAPPKAAPQGATGEARPAAVNIDAKTPRPRTVQAKMPVSLQSQPSNRTRRPVSITPWRHAAQPG